MFLIAPMWSGATQWTTLHSKEELTHMHEIMGDNSPWKQRGRVGYGEKKQAAVMRRRVNECWLAKLVNLQTSSSQWFLQCCSLFIVGWTVSLLPLPTNLTNPYVEVLTASISECDCIYRTVFKDIIKVKWGHMGGPWSNLTGVIIKSGD